MKGYVFILILLFFSLISLAGPSNFQWTHHNWFDGTFINTTVKGSLVLAKGLMTLWSSRFDQGGVDLARSVAVDRHDNIIIAGYSLNDELRNCSHLIKYNPQGRVRWSKCIGVTSRAMDVAADSENNLIAVGYTYLGSYNYQIAKYNPQGEIKWSRIYYGGGEDIATAVAVDFQDNIIVTGYSTLVDLDYYTIKYSPLGEMLWARRYDSGHHDYAFDVAVDSKGNVIVTGKSTGYYTIKYSPLGEMLWARRYDGDTAFGVATDPYDNIIVTGHSGGDFLTIKYDSGGRLLWVRRYDGGGEDIAFAVATDSQGNIILSGSSGLTIKYDSAGRMLWKKGFNRNRSGNQALGVAVDSKDRIVITGTSREDYYTIKYSDGYLPFGAYIKTRDFSRKVFFKELIAWASLNGGEMTFSIEAFDGRAAKAINLKLLDGKHSYDISTLEGRHIKIRVDFYTDDPRRTPLLRSFALIGE
jgi:uncharacterized delta-60 repeat protein